MTRPVFLISLPRSGSTLLQRMLSISPDIATCAEPWLLLPLLGMRNPTISRAAYFHHTAANAINDFIHHVPNGEREFDSAVARFASSLYTSAARGRPYFLDKTPRYYLIFPELKRIFPDARFIILVRHPLAVLASIAATFNNGRFRWFEYWLDWLEGHRCVADAVRQRDQAVHVVSYEDLINSPEHTLAHLSNWLNIALPHNPLRALKDVKLAGRMGDKKGMEQYASLSAASLNKWQAFFTSGHRKAVARRMVNKLNPQDLQVLGYPAKQLLGEVDAIRASGSLDLSGRIDSLVNWLAYYTDLRYLQARYRAARHGEKYAYGFYRHH